jgi:hypothetical protein
MARSQTKTLLLVSFLAALLNTDNAAEPGQEIAPGARFILSEFMHRELMNAQ